MRILVLLYNTTCCCSFYRAGGVFPALRKKMNIEVVVKSWNEVELEWQKITEFDLIFMQRPFSMQALSFCEFMKNFKVPIWVDYDDYLFGVPVENKMAKMYGVMNQENIKGILRLADVVTVATPALKEAYQEYSDKITVIPNAFNDYFFSPDERLGDRKDTFMWRGTDSHIWDVMHKGDQLNALITKNPDWKFLFIGFTPFFLEASKNVFVQDEMDIIIYFQHIRKVNAKALHVPLFDNQFNRCKSNIAYIEAAYAGAIAVVPDWPEWQVPGALNYSDNESYYEQMTRVINKEVDAKLEAKKAWDYVRAELLLSKINDKRVEIIQSLV